MTSSLNKRTGSLRDLTYPWALVAALLACFIVLGVITARTNTLDLDLDISIWAQERGEWAESLANLGNFLGEARVAIGLLVVFALLAAVRHMPRLLWYLAFAASGRLLTLLLKDIFESPRPSETQISLAEVFEHYGYPSGHVATSSIVFGSAAFVVAMVMPDARLRWGCVGLAAMVVCSTAFARIYLGAHWFTDTVGGVLIGVVVVLVAANLSAMVVNRRPQRARSPESVQSPGS